MIELHKGFKFYNADCMDIMKDIPDKYFDLAVVDPPYGIGIAVWDNEAPTENYFNELFRVSKNQIIWGGNYFNLPITQSWICWDKTFNDDIKGGKLTKGGVPRENMSDFELIWTSYKHKSRFLRFTQIGNLIGFNKQIRVDYSHQGKIHPAQKHKALYKWIYDNYAPPIKCENCGGSGDIPSISIDCDVQICPICKGKGYRGQKIIDTHLGSNSNGIAAYFSKMGEFVGIEKDKDYFKDGVNRFIKETSDMFNPMEVEFL